MCLCVLFVIDCVVLYVICCRVCLCVFGINCDSFVIYRVRLRGVFVSCWVVPCGLLLLCVRGLCVLCLMCLCDLIVMYCAMLYLL